MNRNSPRWHQITPSEFPWEQEALDHVRELLPDREPFQAWTNFEFISNGRVYEVDLLVVTPKGFFLVEIKSWRGPIEDNGGSQIWRSEGRTDDNPLILANRKAKKLRSLLDRQQAMRSAKARSPFLQAAVFLSAEGFVSRLSPDGAHHVYGRDGAAPGPSTLPSIRDGLLTIDAEQYVRKGKAVDRPMSLAIGRAMKQAGIRPSNLQRRVGDYELGDLVYDGPGYQDFVGTHSTLKTRGARWRTIDTALVRLTTAQAAILHQIGDAKRVLVTGPAGSGKTILAWEKATRLAMADRRVLLVAYDPRAIDVFDATTTHANIEAWNVEALCLTVAGGDVDRSDLSAHDPFWYGRDLPDALEVHATSRTHDQLFDDLIIDEVFDMWPRIFGALRRLLRDEADACIWLFGDSRQGVTWGGPVPIALGPEAQRLWSDIPPYSTFREGDAWGDGSVFEVQRLSSNCRNAVPIQRILAGRFFGDGSASVETASAGDRASALRVRGWGTGRELRSKVTEAIEELIAQGVEATDIAVLHGCDARASNLFEASPHPLSAPRLVLNLPDGVEVSSVTHFKGDDRQAVVLCEMEDVAATRAQAHWYTALSRARTHVTVLVRAPGDGRSLKINEVLEEARKQAAERVTTLGLSASDIWPVPPMVRPHGLVSLPRKAAVESR